MARYNILFLVLAMFAMLTSPVSAYEIMRKKNSSGDATGWQICFTGDGSGVCDIGDQPTEDNVVFGDDYKHWTFTRLTGVGECQVYSVPKAQIFASPDVSFFGQPVGPVMNDTAPVLILNMTTGYFYVSCTASSQVYVDGVK